MTYTLADRYQTAFDTQPNIVDELHLQERTNQLEQRYWDSYEGHLETARAVREEMRQAAWYGDEHIEELFRQNDALGYQRRYKEAQRAGASNNELEQLAAARRVNISTGFNEALNALDFDLSDPLIYDVDSDGRMSQGGMYVDEMYLRALTPVNCDAELDRREVESATNAAWQELAWQPGATEVGRIDISMRNTDPAAIGYVESIDKMQIRFSKYVDTEDGRKLYTRALLINGLNMGDDFMNRFLRHVEHVGEDEPSLDRTEILARPIISSLEEIDSEVTFVRMMDEFREQESGLETILGVDADLRPDLSYAGLDDIVRRRRRKSKEAIADIDVYAQGLVDDNIPYEEAEMKLEAYQKLWAMKICRDNPDDARKVFDDDTYQALMEVRELEEAGDFAAAEIAFGAAYEDAPSLQGCGATCRLEVAGRAEREVAEARGLEVYEMSGALYVDKTWTCPGCGKTGGLRGGNGIICMGGCGADVINGVRHEKSDYSPIIPIEPKERERPWWKSFARVQAEFEANQARKQSATSR